MLTITSRQLGPGLLLLSLLVFAYTTYVLTSSESAPLTAHYSATLQRKALIVASMTGDDVSWLSGNFTNWEQNIYVMDNPRAKLSVTRNKGRESAAYLSYMVDNYDHLPDYMIFIHPLRYQWHNEDPMYDGLSMLQRLRLSHLDDVGYANLRCTWAIGCPSEMKNLKGELGAQMETEGVFLAAFKELYPELPEPDTIGVACCAQFAVTRSQVLKRPREDYERYLKWLWDTELTDQTAGRVMEYSWHIMMGKPAVYCPSASDCFCEKYGLCNLSCKDEGDCGRFKLPPFATIPEQWPNSGLEGINGWPGKDWWL